MQVEAEAQASSSSDSLHFLTTAVLPTVGKLATCAVILLASPLRYLAAVFARVLVLRFTDPLCPCSGIRFSRCRFNGEGCRGKISLLYAHCLRCPLRLLMDTSPDRSVYCSWGLLISFRSQSAVKQAASAHYGSTHCESEVQLLPWPKDLTAATPTQVQAAQQPNPLTALLKTTLSKPFCQTCLRQMFGMNKPLQALQESTTPALTHLKPQISPITCVRTTHAARAYCPAIQVT